MSTTRDEMYRAEAKEFYNKGKEFGDRGEWNQGKEQFGLMVEKLLLIPETSRSDSDYRELAKGYNNIGISYENLFLDSYNLQMRNPAINAYTESSAMRQKIRNLTPEDELRLTSTDRSSFAMLNPGVVGGPVNDEFDQYCRDSIAKAEAQYKGGEIPDRMHRCLARWNHGLSESWLEDKPIDRLLMAISHQNSVLKRNDYDEQESALYQFSLAERYKQDGMMASAAQACQESLKRLELVKGDHTDLIDEVKGLLVSLGEDPKDKARSSEGQQRSIFSRVPVTVTNDKGEKTEEVFVFSLPTP